MMAVADGCDETLFAQFIFRSQVKEWQESQQALSGRVRDSILQVLRTQSSTAETTASVHRERAQSESSIYAEPDSECLTTKGL